MTATEVEKRTCTICELSQPLSEFARKKGKGCPGGYSKVCKECQAHKKEAVADHVKQNCVEIDKMQLKLIETLKNEAPDLQSARVPSIGDAVEHILRPFGGIEGYGLQLASNFLMADPGGATRQRYASLIAKMIGDASKLGYAKKPLDDMSDEELEAFADELMRRTTTNATESNITEAIAEGV